MVNVGTLIISALSVFLVVFVIFSEYCTTTCQKNKMKKTTKSIKRITAFMARPYVTLAIVKVLLKLCPHLFSYIKNLPVGFRGRVHLKI